MNDSTEKWMYVMHIVKTKTYNKVTKAMIEQHVENLRKLDDSGHLALCGVSKGYPGVAGMLILKAQNMEEAEALCKLEPLVVEGCATYQLFSIQVANRENNYLL